MHVDQGTAFQLFPKSATPFGDCRRAKRLFVFMAKLRCRAGLLIIMLALLTAHNVLTLLWQGISTATGWLAHAITIQLHVVHIEQTSIREIPFVICAVCKLVALTC